MSNGAETNAVVGFTLPDGTELLARAATPGDVPFIVDTWARSYRDALAALAGASDLDELPGRAGQALTDALYVRIRATVQRVPVLVAVSPEAPEAVLGYVVQEVGPRGPSVHYVYVAHPVRRLGVARGLLEVAHAHGGRCTCYTWAGLALARRFQLRFHPKRGKANGRQD